MTLTLKNKAFFNAFNLVFFSEKYIGGLVEVTPIFGKIFDKIVL
jgi:hypothetical protein